MIGFGDEFFFFKGSMTFSLSREKGTDACRPRLDPVMRTRTKPCMEHLLCSEGLHGVLGSGVGEAGSFRPGQRSRNQGFCPCQKGQHGAPPDCGETMSPKPFPLGAPKQGGSETSWPICPRMGCIWASSCPLGCRKLGPGTSPVRSAHRLCGILPVGVTWGVSIHLWEPQSP